MIVPIVSSDRVLNYLTKGNADTLYCGLTGCNYTGTIYASDYTLHNGSSCCGGGGGVSVGGGGGGDNHTHNQDLNTTNDVAFHSVNVTEVISPLSLTGTCGYIIECTEAPCTDDENSCVNICGCTWYYPGTDLNITPTTNTTIIHDNLSVKNINVETLYVSSELDMQNSSITNFGALRTSNPIKIGEGADANTGFYGGSVAIGYYALASPTGGFDSISIGSISKSGELGITIGISSKAEADVCTILGSTSNCYKKNAVILGYANNVYAVDGVILGNANRINGTEGIILGNDNYIGNNSNSSIIIGSDSNTIKNKNIIIGINSTTNCTNCMLIANDGYFDIDNEVKIGANSVTIGYDSGNIVASGNITTEDLLISETDVFIGSLTQQNIDMDGSGNLFVLNDIGSLGNINISKDGTQIYTMSGTLVISG